MLANKISCKSIILNLLIYFSLTGAKSPEIYLQAIHTPGTWVKFTKDTQSEAGTYVTRDGDDFSLVNPEQKISNIAITCQADYPTQWVMTDVQPTILNGTATHSKVVFKEDDISEKGKIPEPVEYITYLVLTNTPSLTGLYTCRSVKDEGMEKSMYVFLPGTNNAVLVNAGKEFEIGFNGQNLVTLPCKVTKKDATVTLQKKEDTDKWMEVPFKTTFDPKRGFTLSKSDSANVIGTYRCFVKSQDEETIISVKDEYTAENQAFPIKDISDGKAKWGARPSGDGIECCSNNKTNPATKLFVIGCDNKPHCEMVKVAYEQIASNITHHTPGLTEVSRKHESSSCVNTATYFLVKPFLLQCVGQGIDFSGEVFTQFPSLTSEKFTYVSIGHEDSGSSVALSAFKLDLNGDMVRVDLDKVIYHGQKLIFQCCGLSYHHAIGRIQRIGWSNETVTPLKTPENDEDKPYTKDFCFAYSYDEPEEYLVEINSNMSYFECIVPVWKDTKPLVAKVDLKIEVIETLKFIDEDVTVNLTYKENQSGLLYLNCSFEQYPESLRIPEVEWTKDDQVIKRIHKFASVVENYEDSPPSSILLFMRATKEIEGEYECSAKNIKDSIAKTFVVKIKRRSFADYWVALGIFGGFFVMIIVLALRVTTLDKEPNVPSMKVERLM